jgi:hypothetical protein
MKTGNTKKPLLNSTFTAILWKNGIQKYSVTIILGNFLFNRITIFLPITMKTNNPLIEWQDVEETSCLKFTFQGELDDASSGYAIEQWQKEFDKKPDEKICLIWDCQQMTGYDPGARHKWQTALRRMKGQIKNIWLISNSNIIRMGAMLMNTFTHLDIHIVRTEEELAAKIG